MNSILYRCVTRTKCVYMICTNVCYILASGRKNDRHEQTDDVGGRGPPPKGLLHSQRQRLSGMPSNNIIYRHTRVHRPALFRAALSRPLSGYDARLSSRTCALNRKSKAVDVLSPGDEWGWPAIPYVYRKACTRKGMTLNIKSVSVRNKLFPRPIPNQIFFNILSSVRSIQIILTRLQ